MSKSSGELWFKKNELHGRVGKIILQLSVLTTAIALAGCGGGGGGFYGPSTSTTTTPTTTTAAVATNYHIVLNTSKSTLVVTGDTAVITEKLVDVNGGGISGQTVTLSIPDTLTNGVTIGGASTAVTDASGNATFTINLPASSGATATALLAKGVTLGGSFTDATGKVVTQSTILSVVSSVSTTTPTPIYHLTMMSNKPSMVVTGDTAIITVKAVDTNGGAVAGQKITFTIPSTLTSGVTLSGPSVVTTDATGNATFNITLPNDSSPASLAASLEATGVTFNASLTNADGSVASQTTVVNVVPTPVTTPVANITFGNSGLITTSPDGSYYIEALSANVVNINGQPIVNQPIVMSINLLGYAKGHYSIVATRVPVRIQVYTANTPTHDCSVKPFPSFAQIATTFVSPSVSTDGTVTYTTDSTGKFDFQVRYLKRFGSWQTVDLIATTTVNGTVVTSDIPYNLHILKTDADSLAGQPFDVSPYGDGTDCANTN
jgi:hypothetical protein